MSNEKQIKSRIQQKMDTSANWEIAGEKGFVPLKGEIIVYSDLGKMKIGDGKKNINELNFTKSQNVQVVEADENTASHTYQDIKDFVDQGDIVVLKDNENHLYNLVKIDDSTVYFSCIADNYLYSYWIYRDGINSIEKSSVQLCTFDDTAPNLIVTIEDEISSNQAGEIAGYASGGANVILIDGSRIYHLDYVDQENLDPGMVIFSSIDNDDNIIFKIKIEGTKVTRWSLEWNSDQSGAQSDWTEADENAGSFIKNKPAIRAGESINSIIEGSSSNQAVGDYSHAEGEKTYAFGRGAHVEGYYSFTPINWRLNTSDSERKVWTYGQLGTAKVGDFVKYENTFLKIKSIDISAKTITFSDSAPGTATTEALFYYYGKINAHGDYSHAEGKYTRALQDCAHAEGYNTIAADYYTHAEGTETKAQGRAAHAEGARTTAFGNSSHAEGSDTLSYGVASHAEGDDSKAIGNHSHAEGFAAQSNGEDSHAEGYSTIADGSNSHAENDRTQATGASSHAEGIQTKAAGKASHAEGVLTLATGENSHAEGYYTNAQGLQSHAEGQGQRTELLKIDTTDELKKYYYYGDNKYLFVEVGNTVSSEVSGVITTVTSIDIENKFIYTQDDLFPAPHETQTETLIKVALFEGKASGEGAHSEGYCTVASARGAHSEGGQTDASGDRSHAEGGQTTASGLNAHAEGWRTLASGNDAHAEGNSAWATASYSHAEGRGTDAEGTASHAEGLASKASGLHSHAEGEQSKAIGDDSHAEGYKTEASGVRSHAEGSGTTAKGISAHAEGELTTAYEDHSHAEGHKTRASGESSHAEGEDTSASGFYSHAEGLGTYATSVASHAEGNNTGAIGPESHAEGGSTIASGENSHAEGYSTKASGMRSHAEGDSTIAKGSVSHAEGLKTKAMGSYSHTEGVYTEAEGEDSHAEGFKTKAIGVHSHAEGDRTVARGKGSHAEGVNNNDISFDILYLSAQGGLKTTYNVEESPWSSYTVTNNEGESNYGFILNADNYYVSQNSHQEYSYALCQISLDMPQSSAICFDVCIDSETFLDGLYFSLLDQTFDASSYAPSSYFAYFTGQKKHEAVVYEVPAGTHTIDIKYTKDESFSSVGEDQAKFKILTPQLSDAYVGKILDSNNNQSKIIGVNISNKTITVDKTLAGVSLSYKIAKVISTGAYGEASHLEGYNTLTADSYSHAEGEKSIASGQASHAEGNSTHAVEKNSHAEGFETRALGEGAHVEGYRTYATGAYSHVEGRYNEIDQKGTYAHIVGGGTSPSDRKNIHTVDWSGNGTYAGMMTANGGLALASGTGYGQDIPEDADEGRIFFMPDNTANCIVSYGQVTPEGEATTWYYEEYESGLVKVWGARTLTLQAGTWKDLVNGVSEYNATLSAILPFSIATVLSETFNVTNHTDFTPFSTKSVARTSSSRTNQYRVAACNNIKPTGNISITINFFILGWRY